MPRKQTFILFILLSTTIFGCDKTPETRPVPPKPEMTTETPEITSSFLDQKLEKVDHDAKYRKRNEIDPNFIIFSDFKSPKPTNWTWTTPKSNMRIANYTLQGDEENDVAELSIIQFDKDEGGTLTNNIKRWMKHFRSNEGGPVRTLISTTKVAGLPTSIVEISGEYMGMEASWHRSNYTMLIALVEFEDGNVFLKLLGPTPTINVHRDRWNSFLEHTTFIEEN